MGAHRRRSLCAVGLLSKLQRTIEYVIVTLLAVLLATIGYAEEPPDGEAAAVANSISIALADPRVAAYMAIADVRDATDEQSLAALAYNARRFSPEFQAAFATVLIESLVDVGKTPLETIADEPSGDDSLNDAAADGASRSKHDLTVMRGRAAFMLDRTFQLNLPACTRNAEADSQRSIQRQAQFQLVLSLLTAQRDMIANLDESQRERIARDIDTPDDILLMLADDRNDDVVIAVANNLRRSGPLLRALLKRSDRISDPIKRKELIKLTKQSLKNVVVGPTIRFRKPRPSLSERVQIAKEKADAAAMVMQSVPVED